MVGIAKTKPKKAVFLTVLPASQNILDPGEPGNGALLAEVSPRDRPWDTHKAQADAVARLYAMANGKQFARLSDRIEECSRWLEFAFHPDLDTGEVRFRLQTARFCRVRYCPICQWRRSLMWAARLMKRVLKVDLGKARWVMLTLTVRNVPLDELRSTINVMNKAWQRLLQREAWPAIGFLRSTEITRAANDYAHPHFHVLMLVPSTYFGRDYISQKQWTALWREALRADYDPVVHIKAFKLKIVTDPETGETRELAPVEGIKYPVKPCDLIRGETEKDAEWLAELTRQTHKLRFLASGGILKNILKEDDETNDDLLRPDGKNSDEDVETLMTQWFLWFDKRYRKRSSPVAKLKSA
jgi:plasmid rolling circle replication initiator protein Rep